MVKWIFAAVSILMLSVQPVPAEDKQTAPSQSAQQQTDVLDVTVIPGSPYWDYEWMYPWPMFYPVSGVSDKSELGKRIAKDASADIDKLKRDIHAKTLELKAIADGAGDATREEIRKLSSDIADDYHKLREKYRDFFKKMHDDAGMVPHPQRIVNGKDQQYQLMLVPITPLYWKFEEIVPIRQKDSDKPAQPAADAPSAK